MKKVIFLILGILFLSLLGFALLLPNILKPSQKKLTLFDISELPNNSILNLHIDLEYTPPGWDILIGDKVKNSSLANEQLEINLINTSKYELEFMVVNGGREVLLPGNSIKWFKGTLNDLWLGKTVIWVQNFHEKRSAFTLQLKFGNRLELSKNHISIIAVSTDSM